MTPILGIMASQISGHLFTPTGSMYHIASTTLSTTATSIEFGSIPADYTHLQIRVTALCSATGYPRLRFNSDSATNYSYHFLYGSGVNAQSGAADTVTFMQNTYAANATNPSVSVIDILDYANTNKYKTMRSLNGQDSNGSGFIWLFSGNWRNTNAITTVTFTPETGNFNAYTSISLYGVK